MSILAKLEKKAISHTANVAKNTLSTAINAFADYKQRHIGTNAASVSFYTIFSVFPLLAFTMYLVGKLIGDHSATKTAPMVLKMLRDFVPAMETWVEKGLFDVIRGNTVTSSVNAVLLGWSGLGLFSALLTAMEHLPEGHQHEERAQTTQVVLAATTLGLFAVFVSTIVFCEMAGKSSKIPFFLQGLPFELQDVLYFGARTRSLLGVTSVGVVALLYKLLLPVRVRIRSAFVGAMTFTGLMLASRSLYWIYNHYNRHSIESSYGVFSALILIMLWVHFCVSCLLYGALLAMHLDKEAAGGAGVVHDPHGAHGADGHGADEHHKHAA